MTPTEEQALGIFLWGFPDARILKEYPTMTTAPAPELQTAAQAEVEDWSEQPAAPAVSYPEAPTYKLADHVYTYSPKLPDGAMVVFRAQTAQELVEAVESFAPLAGRLTAAWRAVSGAPSPVQQQVAAAYPTPGAVPPPPPQGAPPAWAAQAAPPPPPPQQQNGGGGTSRDPKPRPPWPQVFKISLAKGDTSFKDYRGQNGAYFKGKVAWAGGGDYWIHGEVVQAVAQWNPVPA